MIISTIFVGLARRPAPVVVYGVCLNRLDGLFPYFIFAALLLHAVVCCSSFRVDLQHVPLPDHQCEQVVTIREGCTVCSTDVIVFVG